MHQGTSFPVGKVDFLNLYPLNYKEFLLAVGERELVSLLESGDYEMINAFSGKYIDLLRRYYYVGGMPEVVRTYVETDDLEEVRNIQRQLLLYYSNDFSKNAPKETVPRIQMVWDSIPMQLAKENKKFIYGVLREGARAKEFEMSAFKIYMLDVGLLAAKGNIAAVTLLEKSKIFSEFKGALTEQFVAQEFAAAGMELYYYSAPGSSGEIDFVVQAENKVIPVEVKAEENLQAKSLKAFAAKYELKDVVRTSMSNYREQDWMVNVPLFKVSGYLSGRRPSGKPLR